MIAPKIIKILRLREPVLNALRHQRNDRGNYARLKTSGLFVLNALRHQRNDRKLVHQISLTLVMCSTPYGIKGMIARKFQYSGRRRVVLNALRHQRNDRSVTAETTLGVGRCSTPYGIKGMIAPEFPPTGLSHLGAQRLTASKE